MVNNLGHKDIAEVLHKNWGFEAFREGQEQVIRSILSGKDTLALFPTGAGKSLCYQVPALALGRLCIVISPLIALMRDQVLGLKNKGIRAAAVVSGMDASAVDAVLGNAVLGKLDFLFISPERIATEMFQARIARMPVGLIAVDEAHCISQWGYDFRPSYLKISELRDHHPELPILALTATATTRVANDIMERLKFPTPVLIRTSFRRPELEFWVSRGEDKVDRLLHLAKRTAGGGIVYVKSRRRTVELAQLLLHHGVSSKPYHAGLSMRERTNTQEDWTLGKTQFVVATNAFGMGIDKGDVRTVIHMEPPADLESYYQEAGRAGRDGKSSHAILLLTTGDQARLRERVEMSFPPVVLVKDVYQHFANIHRIAEGSFPEESFPLELAKISEKTNRSQLDILNAFKVLELNGTLALSEGAHSPSKIMFIASSGVVRSYRSNKGINGELVEALLRFYGGSFETMVSIDEKRLADQLGVDIVMIQKTLQHLASIGLIDNRPRRNDPSANLTVPRMDALKLHIDHDALQMRKDRAMERMEHMLHYAYSTDTCREVMLLNYFDDPSITNCEKCDVCQRRMDKEAGMIHERISDAIHLDLQKGSKAMKDVIIGTGHERTNVTAVIRWMIDNEEIRMDTDGKLSRKMSDGQ